MAPKTPPAASTVRPISTERRWPNRSQAKPIATPADRPRPLNSDTTQPAPTMPSPNSLRNVGRTGGTLPI